MAESRNQVENLPARVVEDPPQELVPVERKPDVPERMPFASISEVPLSDAEAADLAKQFPDDVFDILPSGEVYASHVHVRRRLSAVFGVGRWALMPASPIKMAPGGAQMLRLYHLYVRGAFVAEGVGGCEYQAGNARMTYDDAVETCQSKALVRAAKVLGMADLAWDKREAEAWRQKFAVKVKVSTQRGPKLQWRRKDAPPFDGEQEAVSGGGAGAQRPAGAASSPTPAPGVREQRTAPAPTTAQSRGKAMGINEPKQKLLRARAAEQGMNDDELHGWLKVAWNVEHLADVDFRDFDRVLEALADQAGSPVQAEIDERPFTLADLEDK